MQRRQQQLTEILEKLSPIESHWMDRHAEKVIAALEAFPTKDNYELSDIASLLDANFEVGLTAIRLFLGLSKDEFKGKLRQAGMAEQGITAYRKNPEAFLQGLEKLDVRLAMKTIVGRPTTWSDVLIERLRSGRGSAIKGQQRGRSLEDFTEEIVQKVFGKHGYHVRCTFVGENGGPSSKQCEFAIPTKEAPRILIEAKAYGATGSKQSDVAGDAEKIITHKRHDTTFLLVTDGVTWVDRKNDLRKLVDFQNKGRIGCIYTIKMANEFEADLRTLKAEHQIGNPEEL